MASREIIVYSYNFYLVANVEITYICLKTGRIAQLTDLLYVGQLIAQQCIYCT